MLGQSILDRILAMLINEAVDAVFWRVATPEDIDLAMVKGVNYPRGLLAWGEELGHEPCSSVWNPCRRNTGRIVIVRVRSSGGWSQPAEPSGGELGAARPGQARGQQRPPHAGA